MEFKVRIFIGEQQVEPSEMSMITISNPTIDRIVNDIVDRVSPESENNSQTTYQNGAYLLTGMPSFGIFSIHKRNLILRLRFAKLYDIIRHHLEKEMQHVSNMEKNKAR